MSPMRWVFPVALVLLSSAIVQAADIYVSPTGKDGAAGTLAAPLATLTAARDMADQVKVGNTPVNVYLRGGTYYLNAPVTFGESNSGTATAPIVYAAYPGEKPVISGGIKVTSSWSAYQGSIMVTTIAQNLKVDQLFLNGTRQVLARYPNFTTQQVILDGSTTTANVQARVSRWANPGEGPGYLRGLHSADWGGNSYIITGKNGTTLTTKWCGDNNRGNQIDPNHELAENIFEELDTAGEWFYRKTTGQLFFWPPSGTNLGSSTVELASLDQLLQFTGSANGSATSVKYIQLNGLTFTQAYRTLFSKPYETVLKSDWAIARAGAIFMQNAENITIENCLFDQVGGNGIFMSGYNRNHVIYNNVFNDGGASCVCLFGLTSAVRCPNSWSSTPTCTDKTPGPVDPVNGEFPAYVRVDNNMMNHFGRFEKQPAGIALSATECDTLVHNTVHDCPRAGICMCDGCWGGHYIAYNWVYNDVLETGDHGPINAWGRDRNERNENDTTLTTLDNWKQTVIKNNRFETTSNNFGIDLDDQASNYLQVNNLIMSGGLKVQWNRYNTYLNNILVNNAQVQITGVWWGSNDYLARNIFTNGSPYWCNFFSPIASAILIADTIRSHIRMLDSNLLASGVTSISTEQGNLPLTQWQQAGLDAHSKLGDPMFVNVNQTWPNYGPKGNYQVQTGSPALSLGFQNFPMDSFGVMPPPPVGTISVPDRPNQAALAEAIGVRYHDGRLLVTRDGEYTVTITTVGGRLLQRFSGKGSSAFALNVRKVGRGVYFATVRAKNESVTGKLLVE